MRYQWPVNRAADHLSIFVRYPLSHHSLAIAYVYFLQLLPQPIVLEFLIRQILQAAGTPPFRNLVTSPAVTLNDSLRVAPSGAGGPLALHS